MTMARPQLVDVSLARLRKSCGVGDGSSRRGTSCDDPCPSPSTGFNGGLPTSSGSRLDHVEAQDATARLEAAKDGSVAGSRAAAGLEESLWLCPIEDRRGLDSTREGMMQGFSLGSYVQLVDYTGRLFRQGRPRSQARIARDGVGSDLRTRRRTTGTRLSFDRLDRRTCLRRDPVEDHEARNDEREHAVDRVTHRMRVTVHRDEHLYAEDSRQWNQDDCLPRRRPINPAPRLKPRASHCGVPHFNWPTNQKTGCLLYDTK